MLTRRRTFLVLNVLAVLGLICWLNRASFTQSPKLDRIAGPVARTPYVWLEGNRRPMFRPENDLGPAEPSLKLENISLIFKLTGSQQADLTALLAEQQNPSSPNYHQWLTPEQYADRFGLSPNDLGQVVGWLQAQGFQMTQTARSRNWVSFSGTAAQVQAAFLTEIHNFSINGQTYYGNATEPAVPAALADVVLGIHALDNYPLRPRSVFRQVRSGTNPNFTSGVSGNTFIAPGDFATIYDLKPLYSAGIDGTGQKIAVMGQTDLYNNGSDIAAFRSASGLPANPPIIKPIYTTDPGVVASDIDEASLDVEWSGAVAPNATIIYVNGGSDGVFNSLIYAVTNLTAPVISISYGACEANWSSTSLDALRQLAQQANLQGQTIVSAAGDSGAADCDSSTTTGVVSSATHGLAVDAPASVPEVTAMGGSEFNEGSGNYWQATAASNSDVLPSALSYIPEMVWNDTQSSANTGQGLLAGGGGVSMHFPKPSWQTVVTPSDNFRDVPDLSLTASPLHDSYLICVQNGCVNGYRRADQTLSVVGGTSMAAPTFAGIVALINQRAGTSQGNVNQTLYAMAQSSPSAFHDITSGNNIVPCTVLSTDTGCPASAEMGYSAGVGYDQASGLGSVDAYNLVMEWGSPGTGNLLAPTLTSPANGATGVALSPTFNWSQVTGNNGYTILIAPSPSYLTTIPTVSTCTAPCVSSALSANSNSYTPSNALAGGTYYWQVQAIPSSGSGYGAWSKIFSFATAGATLPAPTLSAPANGAAAVSLPPTFTWTTVGGIAGYRILIATTQSALPANPSEGTCGGCSVGTTTTASSYTPGASSLAASTTYFWEVQALVPSGGSQTAAWSSISNFTTGATDFSLSASPNSLAINPGASGTSTLTLTPVNGFSATPTLTCAASSTLVGVTCTVGALSNNTATITVTASSTASVYLPIHQGAHWGGWWIAAALIGLMLIAIFFISPAGKQLCCAPARPRRCQLMLCSATLAVVLLASLSCGGGSSGGGGGGTTSQPESGTVTITGTSNGTSHTAQITVSVS